MVKVALFCERIDDGFAVTAFPQFCRLVPPELTAAFFAGQERVDGDHEPTRAFPLQKIFAPALFTETLRATDRRPCRSSHTSQGFPLRGVAEHGRVCPSQRGSFSRGYWPLCSSVVGRDYCL